MQHRRLSNDNSVQNSMSGMGTVHEEKTTEEAKQNQAPVFDGILNNADAVDNGLKVSQLASIPRIVMKDAFVLPSRSMYGTAVEVRCGKLREGIGPDTGGRPLGRGSVFGFVGWKACSEVIFRCILVGVKFFKGAGRID